MKCINCGKDISEGNKICSNCGAEVNMTPEGDAAPIQPTINAGNIWNKYNIYAIICAGVMLLSVFVPYASLPLLGSKISKSLMDGSDGWFFILMVIGAVLLSLKNGSISVIIVGIISMVLAFVEGSDFDGIIQKEIGFYLLNLSAIGITISGIVKLKYKRNIKIIAACIVAAFGIVLFCQGGKSKEVDSTTEDNVSDADVDVDNSKLEKENDVSAAKAITTAVQTALGNENFFEEMHTNHKDDLIELTDEGLQALPDKCVEELKMNLGNVIPKVCYTENGADHFSFMVDDTGNVSVYICTKDNKAKWMITPNLDVEYGGTYVTSENEKETTTEEPAQTEETTEATTEEIVETYTPEEAKQNDISAAKAITTAVQTALGSEIFYEEMSYNHCNELMAFTDEGLQALPDKCVEELKMSLGNVIPKVCYTENGADHFSFMVDDAGNVSVYICTNDNNTKWMITPNLDVEYGGEYVTSVEVTQDDESNVSENNEFSDVYVIQNYQSYVGEGIVTVSLEYQGGSGYLSIFYGDASEPILYEIYQDGNTWYSVDGTHIITYLDDGNIMITGNGVELPYEGTFDFVSQNVM